MPIRSLVMPARSSIPSPFDSPPFDSQRTMHGPRTFSGKIAMLSISLILGVLLGYHDMFHLYHHHSPIQISNFEWNGEQGNGKEGHVALDNTGEGAKNGPEMHEGKIRENEHKQNTNEGKIMENIHKDEHVFKKEAREEEMKSHEEHSLRNEPEKHENALNNNANKEATQNKPINPLPLNLRKDQRPIMYTFFDVIGHTNPPILRAWISSWQLAGWDTRILTMKEAKIHPSFPRFSALVHSAKLSPYNEFCFYRWAAMAQAVPDRGGWMSDIDAFPLYIQPREGLDLPNHGSFTCHDAHVPVLLSGSKVEWNRLLSLLMDTWGLHKGRYSDMFLLETVLKKYGNQVAHIVRGDKHVSEGYFSRAIGAVDCSKYPATVKAVHFAHASSERAFMGGWLEAEVRNRHPNAKLLFKNSENVRIRQNPKSRMYSSLNDNPRDVTIVMNDKVLGDVHYLLNNKFRAAAALTFILRIKNQCA